MKKKSYSPNVTHAYIFQTMENPNDLTMVWEAEDIRNMFLSGDKCLMSVDYDTERHEIVEGYREV